MSFGNTSRERYLNYELGGTAPPTPPATVYLGLVLASATPNYNTGAGLTEPSTGSYARLAITNNTTNWPNASTSGAVSTKANGTIQQMANPTASWGSCRGYALFDASSGGNYIGGRDLTTPITPAPNAPAYFEVGAITITATRS